MWEIALFAGLTAYCAWHVTKHGSVAAKVCAWTLAAIWATLVAASLISPHFLSLDTSYRLQEELGAALDVLGGTVCVCAYIATGRKWPLGVTVLFMLQVLTHRWRSGAPDTYGNRMLAWFVVDGLNLCQLAWVRFGPDTHVPLGIFRRMRGAAHTRPARRGVMAWTDDAVCKAGEWYNNRPVREKSR